MFWDVFFRFMINRLAKMLQKFDKRIPFMVKLTCCDATDFLKNYTE